jgi:hypothetical protein
MQERGQERNSPTTSQLDGQREHVAADIKPPAARVARPLAAEVALSETVDMVFGSDPTVADPNLGVPIIHQVVDQMGIN